MTGPSAPAAPPRVHPVVLVLLAVVSVQFGGALAATLLPLVGVFGSVALRLGLAAAILWLAVRPRLRGRTRQDWAVVSLFALALTAMNLSFYGSLNPAADRGRRHHRIPGPLALAAVLSRRGGTCSRWRRPSSGYCSSPRPSPPPGPSWTWSDRSAATAGACWAAYIVLSRRTGARFSGWTGSRSAWRWAPS